LGKQDDILSPIFHVT